MKHKKALRVFLNAFDIYITTNNQSINLNCSASSKNSLSPAGASIEPNGICARNVHSAGRSNSQMKLTYVKLLIMTKHSRILKQKSLASVQVLVQSFTLQTHLKFMNQKKHSHYMLITSQHGQNKVLVVLNKLYGLLQQNKVLVLAYNTITH